MKCLPERTAYLYSMIGETWNNPAAATPQSQ